MAPSAFRICVVGSSNTDLVVRVPRFPGPGETLHGQTFEIGFGGKGSNQAAMAARLGAHVTVVTRVGRDGFGDNMLANYRQQGIDTTYAVIDDHAPSGVAIVAVDERSGQNSIIVVPGANGTVTAEDVRAAKSAITSAQVLLCQLEIPLAASLEGFRIARQANVPTVFNPAPAGVLSDELLQLTDVLIPNEVETETLLGRSVKTEGETIAAARELQARGARNVIVTLGSRGVLVIEADHDPQFIAAEQVHAVDTTGAGDCFVGSFGYLLASGHNIIDAARRACAIATRSVLKLGAQASFPTRAEVQNLLD